jgi:hypothetical protein
LVEELEHLRVRLELEALLFGRLLDRGWGGNGCGFRFAGAGERPETTQDSDPDKTSVDQR